jgi:hypothetical protein
MSYWLIYYEDNQRSPEIFTSEDAAIARFEIAKLAWSCHLFVQQSTLADRDAKIAELGKQVARWKKAIEGLTPSGSEFVDDPEFCATYIRKRTEYPRMIIEMRQQITALVTALTWALIYAGRSEPDRRLYATAWERWNENITKARAALASVGKAQETDPPKS